ncbi:MAG: cysteine desulfurase NifS [Treponema sp. GWB1_62_6]|nr:MAG: cysteine desulfurase NifS [Treponema sp. GWB1_62_6]OHE67706.1 MAG: cysteine desulfurase NifS [Treponema sp. GWC1_61_84]OHE71861.1 MAG: cysteine desulfurase NifS [Treponema sp. RIFOXYC1_FULL_61_9]HCM29041.1 cysteine desulfurase NifS [Treponema sp.]
MENKRIYMDYNATTPLRLEVGSAIVKDLEIFGNASSMHEAGRAAHARVEAARESVGKLIGAPAERIVFTSGGSESNNTVFQTMLLAGEGQNRNEIVTTAIEHPCVINSAEFLRSRGMKVTFLPVDPDGKVHFDELRAVVNERTLLVSVMLANNEIGTIQDLRAISAIAKEAGAWVHSDAVQAAGKVPVDVDKLGVDYLTLSAHKIYGPKGVGALYARKGAPFEPLIRGGHQEHGLRAGTYNNIGILGFGVAAELAFAELASYGHDLARLRTILRDGFIERVPNIKINGHPREVLPNTLNVSFPGAEGESILLHLDLLGIQASTGSACASGSLDPSHVLMATGVGPELAHGSIRFSLGRDTTEQDVRYVLDTVPPIIARLRAMSTVN